MLDIFLGRERPALQERPPRDPPRISTGLSTSLQSEARSQVGHELIQSDDGNNGSVPDPNFHHPEQVLRETQGRKQKKRLPVLEFSSPYSGSGKSQILYYLAAIAVLPLAYHGVYLDGRGAAVVLLDTDGRFDAVRLRDIAAGIVLQKRRAQDEVESEAGHDNIDLNSLLEDALQHVHVFRPRSSSALLATLRHLDTYLLDLSRHMSASRSLHAILLDSASAYFWQDRLLDEVARTEEIGRPAVEVEHDRQQKQSFHLAVLYKELAEELQRLQACFGCAVVYTTWGVSRSSPPPNHFPGYPVHQGPPSFKPYLPAPWRTFPAVRLLVQRDPVRTFGPGTAVAEAEKDAPIRQDVVLRGKFSAWLDPWGREEWPSRVVAALNRSRGHGSFAFYVTREGVSTGTERESGR